MTRWRTIGPILALGALRLAAQIPDAELTQAPTPARLAALRTAAQRDGWGPHVAPLRAAALRAYQLDKLAAMEAWLNVYRWTVWWARPENEFTGPWIQAVNAAKVGHANMPRTYPARAAPLGQALAPELQAWLLGNTAFSAEFFAVLEPVDYLPNVFQILNELHHRDAARFKKYASLALALAVVYDVPPPPDWPHAQVTAAALPRKFPPAHEAFAWWTHQDEIGRTYHRLARLGAAELKYVVDAAAPFPELEWGARISDYPLSQLARAYTMVRYRNDRLANNNPVWTGKTYRLPDILGAGGICVDQSYFATEIGKARGVPTLFFHGAGKDGRHAWFGFLDSNGKWQLDAGRYAEQRFVTGFARDPQTWGELTDHELQFLSERFRQLPSFQQSRVHAAFAADFLAAGDFDAAARAARKAVNYERRNQDGWEVLVTAAQKSGRDAKTVENVLREAALAFHTRYPDLEAAYVNRVAASLRARGQTSEAEAEVRNIANKHKGGRSDLSVAQARDILQRAVATQPLPEQIRSFNTVLDNYGRGAGIGFFDQIVVGFVEHLVNLQQRAEAKRALERARQTLKVEPNSQLEGEFARVAKLLSAQ
ncbi:MAG: hypothetical protein HZA93_04745 [Verrucomicrobia bacterium]|nr:hypothetical protein [Verrucomicrobiota bacterium]